MNQNVNFTPLSSLEIQKKFEYLIKNKLSCVIWKKGKTQKESILPTLFNQERMRISFAKSDRSKSEFERDKVLINFQIKGLNFFGKGKVGFDGSLNQNTLEIDEEFYKCERRSNFRLLTYPVHNVLGIFKLQGNFEEEEKSSILDFNKKVANDESIFGQFVSLVGEGDPCTNEEQVVIRIQDISVSGVAIIAGVLEKQYFSEGKVLKNLIINFNGDEFKIPEAKVVYIFPYSQSNRKDIEQFKVGVQFINLPASIDNRLGKIINQNMKESDMKRVFEDFLK